MDKKRIVFFTENLYAGGVERISQIILSHFDYQRYDVTLYSVRQYDFDEKIFSPYISYRYIYDSYAPHSSCLKKIWAKIKNKIKLLVYKHFTPSCFYSLFIREKADVAIAFIEGYATRFVAGFPKKTKKIAWVHIELDTFHWSEIAFRNPEEEKQCYSQFDTVACVSQIVKEQADKLFGIKQKSVVLYNPVDVNTIITKASEPSFEQPTDKKRLIALGTLTPRKGFERLIHVVQKLINKGFGIELHILGKGEDEGKLKALIAQLGLQNDIHLHGFKQNPYAYLKASDIYVCSSFAEGYNTAITESLVLGKAVVSTECSGVKEQLGQNNEWGICTPNSEEGLYQGLKEMLSGDNLVRFTEKAQQRGKIFSLDESMKQIYNLIEK